MFFIADLETLTTKHTEFCAWLQATETELQQLNETWKSVDAEFVLHKCQVFQIGFQFRVTSQWRRNLQTIIDESGERKSELESLVAGAEVAGQRSGDASWSRNVTQLLTRFQTLQTDIRVSK